MLSNLPFTSNRAPTRTDGPPAGDTTGRADKPTAAAADAGGDGPHLTQDVLFDLLQNERRRLAIQCLRANGGEAALGDIAEHVAAVEQDTTVAGLASQERKRVYAALYQSHLPKLDRAGVVTYDRAAGTVGLGPAAGQVSAYLPPTGEEPGRAWPRYYLAVGGVDLGIVGAALIAGGLSETVATVLALVAVGSLCCLAAVHTVTARR